MIIDWSLQQEFFYGGSIAINWDSSVPVIITLEPDREFISLVAKEFTMHSNVSANKTLISKVANTFTFHSKIEN